MPEFLDSKVNSDFILLVRFKFKLEEEGEKENQVTHDAKKDEQMQGVEQRLQSWEGHDPT